MPEMPEVHSYKNYISTTSLHKKISAVKAQSKQLIHHTSFASFKKNVGRQTVYAS